MVPLLRAIKIGITQYKKVIYLRVITILMETLLGSKTSRPPKARLKISVMAHGNSQPQAISKERSHSPMPLVMAMVLNSVQTNPSLLSKQF